MNKINTQQYQQKAMDMLSRLLWNEKYGNRQAVKALQTGKNWGKLDAAGQKAAIKEYSAKEAARLGLPKDNLGVLPRFQKNYGKLAAGGVGVYEALGLGKEINSLIQNQNNTDNYINSIKDLAYMNPLGTGQLDPKSQKLLRQIQNGSWQGNSVSGKIGGAMEGGLKALPKAALKGVGLGFIAGPWAGLLGGLGTLAREGVKGANTGQYDAELQGLYDQLNQAEADYRAMRRPANVYQSGLRSSAKSALY